MNNQLGLNFGAIIKNVAIEMYGHDVGAVVQAVTPDASRTIPMVVLEKRFVAPGCYTYQLRGKEDTSFKAGALSGSDGTVHLDRFAAV
jgi:hypothetical protein